MDIEHAKELLATLSDGVNPLTGEVLAESDSCNQVEIVRALNTVLRFMDSHSKKAIIAHRKTRVCTGQRRTRTRCAACTMRGAQEKKCAIISSVQPAQSRQGL